MTIEYLGPLDESQVRKPTGGVEYLGPLEDEPTEEELTNAVMAPLEAFENLITPVVATPTTKDKIVGGAKSYLRGVRALPSTAINTAVGFTAWPATVAGGIVAYLDEVGRGGGITKFNPAKARAAKQKVEETIADFTKQYLNVPTNAEGEMQEQLLGLPLTAAKELSGLIMKKLGADFKLPGRLGAMTDDLSDIIADLMSAALPFKAGHAIRKGRLPSVATTVEDITPDYARRVGVIGKEFQPNYGANTLRDALRQYNQDVVDQFGTAEAVERTGITRRRDYERQPPTTQETSRMEALKITGEELEPAIQGGIEGAERISREARAGSEVLPPPEREPLPLQTPRETTGEKAAAPFRGERLGIGDTGEGPLPPPPRLPVADMTIRNVLRMRGELGETLTKRELETGKVTPARVRVKEAQQEPPASPSLPEAAGGEGVPPQPGGGAPPTSTGKPPLVSGANVEKAIKSTLDSGKKFDQVFVESVKKDHPTLYKKYESVLENGKALKATADAIVDKALAEKRGAAPKVSAADITKLSTEDLESIIKKYEGVTQGAGKVGEPKVVKAPRVSKAAAAKSTAIHTGKAFKEVSKALRDILGDERGSVPVVKGKPIKEDHYDKVKDGLRRAYDEAVKAGHSAEDFIKAIYEDLKDLGDRVSPIVRRFVEDLKAAPKKEEKGATTPITTPTKSAYLNVQKSDLAREDAKLQQMKRDREKMMKLEPKERTHAPISEKVIAAQATVVERIKGNITRAEKTLARSERKAPANPTKSALLHEMIDLEHKLPEMKERTRVGRAMDALLTDKEAPSTTKPEIVAAAEKRIAVIKKELNRMGEDRPKYTEVLQATLDYLEERISGIKEAARPTSAQRRLLRVMEKEQDKVTSKLAYVEKVQAQSRGEKVSAPPEKVEKWATGPVHNIHKDRFPDTTRVGDIVNVKMADGNIRKGKVLGESKGRNDGWEIQLKPGPGPSKGGMVSMSDKLKEAGLKETPKETQPTPVKPPPIEDKAWGGRRVEKEIAVPTDMAKLNAEIDRLSNSNLTRRTASRLSDLLLQRTVLSNRLLKDKIKGLESKVREQAAHEKEEFKGVNSGVTGEEVVVEGERPLRKKPGPMKKASTEEREARVKANKDKATSDVWDAQKQGESGARKNRESKKEAEIEAIMANGGLTRGEAVAIWEKGAKRAEGLVEKAKQEAKDEAFWKAFGTTITNERGSAPVVPDYMVKGAETLTKVVRRTVDAAKMTAKRMDTLVIMANKSGKGLEEFAKGLGFTTDETAYLKNYAGVGNETPTTKAPAPTPAGPSPTLSRIIKTKDYKDMAAERRATLAEKKLRDMKASMILERKASTVSAALYKEQRKSDSITKANLPTPALIRGQHSTTNPHQTGAVIKQRNVGTPDDPLWAPAIREGEGQIMRDAPNLKHLPSRWSIEVMSETFDKLGQKVKEVVQQPLYAANHNVIVEVKNLGDWMKDNSKGLSSRSRNNVGIWLLAQREGGPVYLAKTGVKVPNLTPREMKAAKAINAEFKKYYDRLQDARLRSGLEPFPKVDNYITFFEDYTRLQEMGIDPLNREAHPVNDLLKRFRHGRSTPFRFTDSRHDIYKVRTDAFEILKRYAVPALNHIHLGPEIAKGRELINNYPAIGEKGKVYSLRESKPNTYMFLSRFYDGLSGNKLDMGLSPFVDKVVAQLTNNVAIATMGGNFRSALIQPTALLNAHNELGTKYMAKGIADLFTRSNWESAKFMSNHLLGRGFDASVMDAFNKGVLGRTGKVIQTGKRWSMKPLTSLDYMAAMATWRGAFHKGLDMKMGKEGAARYADDIVVRTQGSASAIDRAPIQQHTIGRAITVFQTFTLFNWSFLKRHVAGFGNEKITNKQAFKRSMMWLGGATLLNIVFENGLHTQSPFPAPITAYLESREAGDSKKWALFMAAAESAQMVPFIGSVRYGSTPLGAVAQLAGELSFATSGRQGQGKELTELGGKMTGMPGTQQTVKSIRAYKKGVPFPEFLFSTKPPKTKGGVI